MPFEPTIRRPSTSRILLVLYLGALIYGSLVPWSGWQASGASSLSFIVEPWPRYWTWFDVFANVLLYQPLGLLLQLSFGRPVSGASRVIGCVLFASLLSMAIEASQSYLPVRVPSRLDWLANTTGAMVGGLIGAKLLKIRRFAPARLSLQPWLRGSAIGPALLLVWVLIQMNPQRLLFGSGDFIEAAAWLWLRLIESGSNGLTPITIQASQIANSLRFESAHAVLIEAAGSASAIVAIGMLIREIFVRHAPRSLLTTAVLVAAITVKASAVGILFGIEQAFSWLSAGAQGGLLTGTLLLAVLASASRKTRLLICVAALALNMLLTCGFPVDAYYESATGRWEHREWRNLTALLRMMSLAWPFAAIGWSLFRLKRAQRDLGSIIRGQ